MAEMIEMLDFAEDTEQIPEENIDEAASDDDSETETAEAEEQADSERSETAEPMPEEATQVPEIDYDQFLPILDFSKVSEEEICGAACNKLLQDSYFGMNGFPVIACFLWAYNKAKNDLDFAKQVCVKSKNFAKAFDYLKKTVMYYRTGGNSGVGMDHRQIFAVLEEYFALDDAEIARKEAEAKAKAEQERKANAAKRATKTKAEKKSAAKDSDNAKNIAPKSAKEKKEKKAEPPQISFDDLLGGVC